VIYVDTSVALAHLLAEDRHPPGSLWTHSLISSRLLEYEMFSRLNALDAPNEVRAAARELVARIAMIEMIAPVLAHATEEQAPRLRTLDALHLASAQFVRAQGVPLTVATYDGRFADAAKAQGFALEEL